MPTAPMSFYVERKRAMASLHSSGLMQGDAPLSQSDRPPPFAASDGDSRRKDEKSRSTSFPL